MGFKKQNSVKEKREKGKTARREKTVVVKVQVQVREIWYGRRREQCILDNRR